MWFGERVLVLAAHADDETLGCGGTIARLSASGIQVVVAAMTDGVGSRFGASQRDVETRLAQAHQVATHLGFEFLDKWGALLVPDNGADGVPLLELARMAEALIERYRPTAVFTHSDHDLNVDHRQARVAALTATRPKPGQVVRAVYGFEVPSSTEWGEGSFRPNLFVDISKTLDLKRQAMTIYSKEQPAFPHPRSDDALAALARWRGATVGVEAAEGFEVIRCCV